MGWEPARGLVTFLPGNLWKGVHFRVSCCLWQVLEVRERAPVGAAELESGEGLGE